MTQILEKRVTGLEDTLQEFIRESNRNFIRVSNSIIDLKLEMSDFKQEMSDFKDENRKTIAKMQEDQKNMNMQWGNLANKMGTMVEDLVFPNIAMLAEKYFDCPREPLDIMIRRYRKHSTKDKRKEFDMIAIYKDKVILNETKVSVRKDRIDEFVDSLPEFTEYFPEYAGLMIIPVMASLRISDNMVQYATEKKVYVMGMSGGYMDIYNPGLIIG